MSATVDVLRPRPPRAGFPARSRRRRDRRAAWPGPRRPDVRVPDRRRRSDRSGVPLDAPGRRRTNATDPIAAAARGSSVPSAGRGGCTRPVSGTKAYNASLAGPFVDRAARDHETPCLQPRPRVAHRCCRCATTRRGRPPPRRSVDPRVRCSRRDVRLRPMPHRLVRAGRGQPAGRLRGSGRGSTMRIARAGRPLPRLRDYVARTIANRSAS